jgi:dTDP-glucose 4,6-dehydratase
MRGEALPVYGTGANVRDWLHVDDHAQALEAIVRRGIPGATYLVGAREGHSNITVVTAICDLLDARLPLPGGGSRRDLIRLVTDRQGHDRRYAVDPSRIEQELGWRAGIRFGEGLAATIDWYLRDAGKSGDALIEAPIRQNR